MVSVNSLDHLVLTVSNVETTISFYRDVLGMEPEKFTPDDGSTRWALLFGEQKINLHQAGHEFEPKAQRAMAGSADLCFLSTSPLADWLDHLGNLVIEGPIKRTGATGVIMSIYLRDPDGNLIEISNTIQG